ncbi:MAG: GTPase HflX, partial [Betaproteobacteria bacterium]
MQTEVRDKPRLAVVAAVQLPNVTDVEFDASITELRQLAKTLGFSIVRTFTQKRPRFDATAYLGVGKRDEMRRFIGNVPDADDDASETPRAADVNDAGSGARGESRDGDTEAGAAAKALDDAESAAPIDAVFVDHEISPSQARNLEKEVGCAVSDRTMVILEIFHRNARSRAARAQVEIARLAYMAPRLRELAKIAGPQGRQRSGTGGRGAGESHTELDRRKLRDQISDLKKEIAEMDAERQTQRARRREREELATVAL